jgi:CMP-N,N'-diacetyllegionaminic acid synthase
MIKKKYLALVLARKGSRRLKNKNILKLGSKPLISWTLSNLKKIRYLFVDILVSSDSDVVKKISKDAGLLFVKRPNNLAKSRTSSESSAIHSINYYQKKYNQIKYVILFQPTSPFRKNSTIKKVLKLSVKNPSKQIVTVNNKSSKPNGLIYLTPVKTLKKFKSFSNKNFLPLITKSKEETIDIDTRYDFKIAKKFIDEG